MKKTIYQFLTVLAFCALLAFGLGFLAKGHAEALPDSYKELRYCGTPKVGSLGQIIRDQKAIATFKKIHPCPSTGKTTGACNGWAIDHVVPLACGGCDAVSNMQWLPDTMKNHAGVVPKDRWERKVYAKPEIYDGHGCKFEILRDSTQ